MGNLLYTLMVILLILWAIGYFGYHTGATTHFLLVIVVILLVIELVRGKKV